MTPNRNSTASSSAKILALALLAFAPSLPASAASRHIDKLFLSRPFPIEAAPSFPGGLFHWIDSLAGLSGGKTIPAYRADFHRRFGPLSDEDRAQLAGFGAARGAYASPHPSEMLGVFCSSATVEDAMAAVRLGLPGELADRLERSLAYFRPRYEIIWDHGTVPLQFLDRVRRDGGRDALEALLEKIVRFYDVDPGAAPAPRLALVPVPSGFGTHAEAVGRVLLLEIREGEGLADEASVVVHETSHFLWGLVPVERQERLSLLATKAGKDAARIFGLFREAIPTALGQGVADRLFRPSVWGADLPWYHIKDVDTCAKRIFPMVSSALDAGLVLDESFIRRAIAAASAPP